jgi:hypothetical protein
MTYARERTRGSPGGARRPSLKTDQNLTFPAGASNAAFAPDVDEKGPIFLREIKKLMAPTEHSAKPSSQARGGCRSSAITPSKSGAKFRTMSDGLTN